MATLTLDPESIAALAKAIAAELKQPAETPAAPAEKLLWNETEVAGMLGISVFYLREHRAAGHIVPHSSRRPILYDWAAIERAKTWLASPER